MFSFFKKNIQSNGKSGIMIAFAFILESVGVIHNVLSLPSINKKIDTLYCDKERVCTTNFT